MNQMTHMSLSPPGQDSKFVPWGSEARHFASLSPKFPHSVVILAKKSRQIANKGLMFYYGRYRSQLTLLKSSKQNWAGALG